MRSDFPFRSQIAAAFLGLAALAGCSCPANQSPPPQFRLAFSTDTASSANLGFLRAEIRSAYLVRYASGDFQQRIDTMRQATATSTPQSPLIIYYRSQLPAQLALPDFVSQSTTARSYRLVVPAANRSYDITNVVLEQTAGTSRCASELLSRSEATVDGQLVNGLNEIPLLTK